MGLVRGGRRGCAMDLLLQKYNTERLRTSRTWTVSAQKNPIKSRGYTASNTKEHANLPSPTGLTS
jgi:hypothetical protein